MPAVHIQNKSLFNQLLAIAEQLNLSDLEQLMARIIALRAKQKAPSLPKEESELLLKINKGLPSDIQNRFDELVVRRQAEILTPSEHRELTELTEKIEKSDSERMKCIAKLARVRGITPDALMKELKVYSSPYV